MRKVRGEEEETAWQGILSFLCSPLCSGFKRRAERWNTEFLQQVVLVVFSPPLSRCSCRKRLREKQIRFTSRLICALIWYVQSVYSNCDTKFEYLASPRLTTAASKHSKIGLPRRQACTHTHKSLSLSHTHTHTHNLKCPICIPNTGKKVSSATKNKKCLVRVFCSDKQKLKNQ